MQFPFKPRHSLLDKKTVVNHFHPGVCATDLFNEVADNAFTKCMVSHHSSRKKSQNFIVAANSPQLPKNCLKWLRENITIILRQRNGLKNVKSHSHLAPQAKIFVRLCLELDLYGARFSAFSDYLWQVKNEWQNSNVLYSFSVIQRRRRKFFVRKVSKIHTLQQNLTATLVHKHQSHSHFYLRW